MTDEMNDIPLEEDREPSDNELKSVVGLAREQYQLERDIEKLEEQLKEKREQLKNVAERELPQLMTEIGLSGYTLKDGTQLALQETVYASPTKDNLPAVHQWLEEHGSGDIIKRKFVIQFNKEDERWAKKFQRDLDQRKRPLDTTVDRAVHPQTLQKFVRESLVAGVNLPEDIFGIYKKKTTKLIPPKMKT